MLGVFLLFLYIIKTKDWFQKIKTGVVRWYGDLLSNKKHRSHFESTNCKNTPNTRRSTYAYMTKVFNTCTVYKGQQRWLGAVSPGKTKLLYIHSESTCSSEWIWSFPWLLSGCFSAQVITHIPTEVTSEVKKLCIKTDWTEQRDLNPILNEISYLVV